VNASCDGGIVKIGGWTPPIACSPRRFRNTSNGAGYRVRTGDIKLGKPSEAVKELLIALATISFQ
jgi:hypothetical protein